jgi:hypothetical protein
MRAGVGADFQDFDMSWSTQNGEPPPPLRSSWRNWMGIAQRQQRTASANKRALANWRPYNPAARSSRFRMVGGGEDDAA